MECLLLGVWGSEFSEGNSFKLKFVSERGLAQNEVLLQYIHGPLLCIWVRPGAGHSRIPFSMAAAFKGDGGGKVP